MDELQSLALPDDWKIAELKEFAKVAGGKRMPKGRPFSQEPTPFPYIRVSNLKHGTVDMNDLRYVLPEDQKEIKRYTISKNDLYISIAGTLGVVGTVPDELDGAQLTENAAKIVIDSGAGLSREFLKYCLSGDLAQRQIGMLKGVGGGVPKLALFRIETIQFPLPPLAEQRKLAAVLSSVDAAIEKTQAVIEQVQVVKKGLMQELLTRGLPGRHKKFKQTEIGEIPASWEVVELQDPSERVRNGFVGTATPHYRSYGIPYLVGKNIRENRFALGQLTYISENFHQNGAANSRLRAGDVLTVQSGHIGVSAVVPPTLEGANCHALIMTRPNRERLNGDYLAYYFNSPVGRRRLHDQFVTSTIPHIRTTDLRRFLIPLPPLSEQEAIAAHCTLLDARSLAETANMTALRHLKQALMSVLLTGELRVAP
jgi:type I restriction enzyme S subunit